MEELCIADSHLWSSPNTTEMIKARSSIQEEDRNCVQYLVRTFEAKSQLGRSRYRWEVNLLKPTGYLKDQQFNIQQLHALPTLYFCVLYLSENKQRLVPLTA